MAAQRSLRGCHETPAGGRTQRRRRTARVPMAIRQASIIVGAVGELVHTVTHAYREKTVALYFFVARVPDPRGR